MRLPRPMRVRARSDFQRSRKAGKSIGGKFLVLSVLPDERLEVGAVPFRFGIILTKKVGNAVVRNRVRRRVRGLLSRYGGRIKAGYQLVIIGRYTAPDAEHGELEADWLQLLRRAGILEKEEGVEG